MKKSTSINNNKRATITRYCTVCSVVQAIFFFFLSLFKILRYTVTSPRFYFFLIFFGIPNHKFWHCIRFAVFTMFNTPRIISGKVSLKNLPFYLHVTTGIIIKEYSSNVSHRIRYLFSFLFIKASFLEFAKFISFSSLSVIFMI